MKTARSARTMHLGACTPGVHWRGGVNTGRPSALGRAHRGVHQRGGVHTGRPLAWGRDSGRGVHRRAWAYIGVHSSLHNKMSGWCWGLQIFRGKNLERDAHLKCYLLLCLIVTTQTWEQRGNQYNTRLDFIVSQPPSSDIKDYFFCLMVLRRRA